MKNVLSVLKKGHGFFGHDFVLAGGKPQVKFRVMERDQILGPANRYYLTANYMDPAPHFMTVGDLTPVNDAGLYELSVGDRVFQVQFMDSGKIAVGGDANLIEVVTHEVGGKK